MGTLGQRRALADLLVALKNTRKIEPAETCARSKLSWRWASSPRIGVKTAGRVSPS